MESATVFKDGDTVTWNTRLPKRRRRESIARHGKGPFKARRVQRTPRDLGPAMQHGQMMLLENSSDPEVLVSGALLIKLDT